MNDSAKFISRISEYGFDINKPFGISCAADEDGVELSVIIQGHEKKIWNSDIRLAAITHLISLLDYKHDLDADYSVFQKYMLAILDSIGNVISWAAPYDDEIRNIEIVKKFIEDALNSDVVVESEKEGLIDKKEDDIDFGS
ncbi:hypothetical protein [Brevibacillus choshinensis]|uniref:hypothetical protein n=1 Tax=Brevibacillus choshinensis TaxID=54911 RepID=UPI002E1F45F8|nr:hypothetical protein [Brevibacillus choshinensis]